ncbi:hypothetical protein [Acinetobacter rudis]|uniref:Uncharacterized protein n=1 Tax=Acinetobacter rudis TaxID=632955 RepID=A0AAW8J4K8_9GAMM|nr:hypothetical protein [Acinetobacter rudis]MDQ8934640.1 hypothetical protein [Acinetobacter rudis]MDQ9016790.1 hypothetical protein [Acinetobacter rudis]
MNIITEDLAKNLADTIDGINVIIQNFSGKRLDNNDWTLDLDYQQYSEDMLKSLTNFGYYACMLTEGIKSNNIELVQKALFYIRLITHDIYWSFYSIYDDLDNLVIDSKQWNEIEKTLIWDTSIEPYN